VLAGALAARVRTTNLAEVFFRHLRRYLDRFPGCVDEPHREQVLGCFILACERAHAGAVLRDSEHLHFNSQQKRLPVPFSLTLG